MKSVSVLDEIVRKKAEFEHSNGHRVAKEIVLGGIFIDLVLEAVNVIRDVQMEMPITRRMLEVGQEAKLFGVPLVLVDEDTLEVR